jgi:succinate-semialdehyde dehydrogenase/glutarate-semialdehyde dehydrogenase
MTAITPTVMPAPSLANATESGLSAYIFTTNLNRALRVAEALEVGILGINEGGLTP